MKHFIAISVIMFTSLTSMYAAESCLPLSAQISQADIIELQSALSTIFPSDTNGYQIIAASIQTIEGLSTQSLSIKEFTAKLTHLAKDTAANISTHEPNIKQLVERSLTVNNQFLQKFIDALQSNLNPHNKQKSLIRLRCLDFRLLITNFYILLVVFFIMLNLNVAFAEDTNDKSAFAASTCRNLKASGFNCDVCENDTLAAQLNPEETRTCILCLLCDMKSIIQMLNLTQYTF